MYGYRSQSEEFAMRTALKGQFYYRSHACIKVGFKSVETYLRKEANRLGAPSIAGCGPNAGCISGSHRPSSLEQSGPPRRARMR